MVYGKKSEALLQDCQRKIKRPHYSPQVSDTVPPPVSGVPVLVVASGRVSDGVCDHDDRRGRVRLWGFLLRGQSFLLPFGVSRTRGVGAQKGSARCRVGSAHSGDRQREAATTSIYSGIQAGGREFGDGR